MAELKINRKSAAKRYGARYGRSLKEKLVEIEKGHRGRHLCPYCSKKTVRRLAAGIWECSSCKAKFTGNAYSLTKESTADKEEVQHVQV